MAKKTKRYTIYRILASGRQMVSVRSGSLGEMRDYCNSHYARRRTGGRVHWEDGRDNRYVIHSYRPIFVPKR